jgi:hypothetical protein
MIPVPGRSAEKPIQDVSPELIAAITERVKKELVEHLKQSANVEGQQKTSPSQPPAVDKVESSKKAASVEELEVPTMQREPSNKSQASTSSPPPTTRTASKPARAPSPQSEYLTSPPRSPSEKLTGVRFSDRPLPRPGAGRSSSVELSTIDQKWGRLFDTEGNPTQRLGQFLGGLANHIVSVVTIVLQITTNASYRLRSFQPRRALWLLRQRWRRFIWLMHWRTKYTLLFVSLAVTFD